MTRDEEITGYALRGLLTQRQAGQALGRVCADQWQCARDYRASESTWRKSAAQIAKDWADGCGQCGGTLPEQEQSESIRNGVELTKIGARW